MYIIIHVNIPLFQRCGPSDKLSLSSECALFKNLKEDSMIVSYNYSLSIYLYIATYHNCSIRIYNIV